MSDAETDIKLQNSSSEGKNRAKNQDPKKITTKDMIHQALTELKSRKGTSLYAIKKYIEETYKVDVEKLKNVIKKSIKSSVEAGTIVQTKGIGASGSFKLAPGQQKPEKKPKAKKSIEKPTTPATADKTDVTKKTKSKEKNESQKSKEKNESQKLKKKVKIAESVSKEKKAKSKNDSGKATKKDGKVKTVKTSKNSKMAEELNRTPIKKKSAMMKRKSIGSIIKPPKMNPKKG